MLSKCRRDWVSEWVRLKACGVCMEESRADPSCLHTVLVMPALASRGQRIQPSHAQTPDPSNCPRECMKLLSLL